MNLIRTIVALVWLTGLLPWMAQASDADRFVAASRSQQAELLTQWAASPEAARLPLLQALQQENLFVDTQKHAFAQRNGDIIPLGESRSSGVNQSRSSDEPVAGARCDGYRHPSACE